MADKNISQANRSILILDRLTQSKKLKEIELENISSEKQNLANSIIKTNKIIDGTISDNILDISEEISFFLKFSKNIDEINENLKIAIEETKNVDICAGAIQKACSAITKNLEKQKDCKIDTKMVDSILSLGKLLRKCIKEELYDEVFSIICFRRNLNKYIDDSSPLMVILEEVNRVKNFFVSDLIKKLTGDISLSQCIKIIGCLKKILELPDSDIKHLFLNCRSISADSQFNSLIGNNSISNNISNLNSIMQTQISWTITFYLAIFNEGKSLLFLCPTDNNSYLFSWIQTYTNKYLKLLQDFLLQQSKTITHDNFSQLIESFSQTSYCVALFDRNYIEISTSVGKIFKETLLQFYTQMSEKAKQDFRIQINSTNLQVLCNNSEFTPSKYPISVNSMLVFGPIARLYNTFITINNCYSIFPCVDIIPDLSTKLQHILEHAAEIIKNIHDKKSKEIYSNAFIFIFLPNVFQLIWKNVHSSKNISTYLGLGPIDYIQYLQNLRKLYHDFEFPNKIEYDIFYYHFKARDILAPFVSILDPLLISQQEYNLMFIFQFTDQITQT